MTVRMTSHQWLIQQDTLNDKVSPFIQNLKFILKIWQVWNILFLSDINIVFTGHHLVLENVTNVLFNEHSESKLKQTKDKISCMIFNHIPDLWRPFLGMWEGQNCKHVRTVDAAKW